jgi:hypothetical protein
MGFAGSPKKGLRCTAGRNRGAPQTGEGHTREKNEGEMMMGRPLRSVRVNWPYPRHPCTGRRSYHQKRRRQRVFAHFALQLCVLLQFGDMILAKFQCRDTPAVPGMNRALYCLFCDFYSSG